MSTSTLTPYIDTPAALLALVENLAHCRWVALDTEFQREKTYYPKLCLLQLATPDWAVCVDPLAITDLGPLLERLYDPQIIKVFHSGGQDLEIFHHYWQRLPTPLFDTQLAAPLLGYPEQIGYANLVETLLGTALSKSQTRTDWTRRPLSSAQIDYALDDVRYLVKLYQHLHAELVARGRMSWLESECATLADPSRYQTQITQAWQKVKGTQRLRKPALARLQALATWRETTAQNQDLPRNWVIKDEVLVDIAQLGPKNRAELQQLRSLPANSLQHYGDELMATLAAAPSEPQELAEYRPSQALSVQEEALVDALSASLGSIAAEQMINPVSIASRKQLIRMVRGTPVAELLSSWRYPLAGPTLEQVLNGKLQLQIDNQQLRLYPVAE